LRGEFAEAKYHAEKAKRGLATGSPAFLRAEDISMAASQGIR
jgi:hypothetical protein